MVDIINFRFFIFRVPLSHKAEVNSALQVYLVKAPIFKIGKLGFHFSKLSSPGKSNAHENYGTYCSDNYHTSKKESYGAILTVDKPDNTDNCCDCGNYKEQKRLIFVLNDLLFKTLDITEFRSAVTADPKGLVIV